MKIRTIPTGPQSNEHEVPIAIMAFIATRVRSSLLFLTAYIYLCLQHHASWCIWRCRTINVRYRSIL